MNDLFKRAKSMFGHPEPEAPKSTPARKPIQPYHAVSIAPGDRCCAASRDLVGKRFLSRDAPPLPLKDCTQPTCTCRYAHYDDRRKGPRRATELGVSIDGYVDDERRAETAHKGRRRNDD
jgi:hypothetical protein